MEENQTSSHQFQFPKGFASSKFLGEIKFSAETPVVAVERGKLTVPCFIQQADGGYYYIPVTINYVGQSLDYAKCLLQCYAELRKHFYGDALFQRELEDDDLLNQHITAVKLAFPKPNASVVKVYSKYKIQLACEKLKVEGVENVYLAVEQAIKNAGKWSSWSNIIDIRSDNPELLAVLPLIKQAFPTVDVEAVLADCLA